MLFRSAGHASGGGAVTWPHVRCLAVPQPWRLYWVAAAAPARRSSQQLSLTIHHLCRHGFPGHLLADGYLSCLARRFTAYYCSVDWGFGSCPRYARLSSKFACVIQPCVTANYNPRGLQLDAEGNIEPHTGPVVTSFFGMLRRVKRIEVSWSSAFLSSVSDHDLSQGWAGLYKGFSTLLRTADSMRAQISAL